jgi:hypothetical protein
MYFRIDKIKWEETLSTQNKTKNVYYLAGPALQQAFLGF